MNEKICQVLKGFGKHNKDLEDAKELVVQAKETLSHDKKPLIDLLNKTVETFYVDALALLTNIQEEIKQQQTASNVAEARFKQSLCTMDPCESLIKEITNNLFGKTWIKKLQVMPSIQLTGTVKFADLLKRNTDPNKNTAVVKMVVTGPVFKSQPADVPLGFGVLKGEACPRSSVLNKMEEARDAAV